MILNKAENYKGFIKLAAMVVIFVSGLYIILGAEYFYWLNGLRTANESEFKHEQIYENIVRMSASHGDNSTVYMIHDLQMMPLDIQQKEYSPKALYYYSSLFNAIFRDNPVLLIAALTLMFLRNIYNEITPFTLKNAKLLRIIACIIIVYGVFRKSIVYSLIYKYVFNTIWFEFMAVYMDWLTIMCGILLFMVSIAFSYGVYLQEEYNDTV